MAVKKKFIHKQDSMMRDVRPLSMRIAEGLQTPTYSSAVFIMSGCSIFFVDWALAFADLILVINLLYAWWLFSREKKLPFKLPLGAKFLDPNNGREGQPGKPEGILYVGNDKETSEEIWFTNSDARTHMLYLGTTGAGKTVGLTSMVTNAMAWASGFVYVDGKADTDLWSALSSLTRRFGRDDDLLVLNYMTGNSDAIAPSNTMNPFSSGSASYLVNMLVELMPDSEGDNAMWKERAVSLVGAMMPALTYKRDYQDIPMSVRTIRDYLSLNNVIKLARDEFVPAEIRAGLTGYLDTLPGFSHEAYDDQGNVKPPSGGGPPPDTTTANQQHGYLAMQFTRALQSLGDDYGYIFDTQAADVDMLDVVLQRRVLVVLIPALEKSGDEIANLGKIVAATMKGMMGSTLGSTVEGSTATVIENKPTNSATPFMTVFDEVGYYTASGMAVMAAQARSLGFSLIFAGQDLPAMKKRVREEANSITANCNIKIFGKLEDPTETKEFFEKTVGEAYVTEVGGFQASGGSYSDNTQASVQQRGKASYSGLKAMKEGQAIVCFGEDLAETNIFYANPGHAKAMRVSRFMSLPPPNEELIKNAPSITKMRDLLVNKTWTAMNAEVAMETKSEIAALAEGYALTDVPENDRVAQSIAAIVHVHGIDHPIDDAPPAVTEPDAKTQPAAAPPPTPPESSVPVAPLAAPETDKAVPDIAPPPRTSTAAPAENNKADDGQKTEGDAANPMGLFGNGDKAKAPEQPAAQEPASQISSNTQNEPVQKGPQWDKIIEDGLQGGSAEDVKPDQPVAPPANAGKPKREGYQLPMEIEDILKQVGSEARSKLFGDGSSKE